MDCVLLGGSNSVLKFGIGSGLESKVQTKRLGLGATSCIQNLYELERNKELIRHANFVVTESNVNDSFFAASPQLSIESISTEIDEYYRILSMTNRNVYVVILPANHHAPHMERVEFINSINERHILNCLAHGFKIVNLSAITTELPVADVMNLIPHPRHLHEGFLHQLGINIANHAQTNQCNLKPVDLTGPSYTIIEASMIQPGETTEKKNSIFREDVAYLTNPKRLPPHTAGLEIIAISAWSDGYSLVKISNKNHSIVKCFSKLYSVWELSQPITIDIDTTIESAFDNPEPTDKSRLSKYNKANKCLEFGLIGLLAKKTHSTCFLPTAVYDYLDIDISKEVSPSIAPYVKACHSFLENRKLVPLETFEAMHEKLKRVENELATLKLETTG
ncbi:hypothetical protein [Pseudomonas putida]|jgi:hypothetical protein|uniref:hypothetical protein n=1 Tax=Pseudomonas putida TaxID=303 RepID=UPI001179E31B|nr:hypothetical protein [Pseudomonas putida]